MTSSRISRKDRDFSAYRVFTCELRKLVSAPLIDGTWTKRVEACLDGTAGAELRRLVNLPVRRAFGVFFTGSKLAERLLDKLKFNPAIDFIYDPAVGAGDLLLAAAKRLPMQRTLTGTLETWGGCLAGTDLQAEFIEATKLRVALLARQRHGKKEELPKDWRKHFPYFRTGNGLNQPALYSRATHLIMNPPFSVSGPLEGCNWAGGRVSDAALFVVRALEQTKSGTRLLAVLPDVLRSGSFQHHWRQRVSDLAEVNSVKRYGIFDESADIDVFLLSARRRQGESARVRRWPKSAKRTTGTVGDFFDVHVGRVVPHRDPEKGPEHPYIHPRCVPTWTVLREFSETRRHEGSVYDPPFIVIRRTSRPSHPYRATATVISGTRPVAVENHLIVCEPKKRTLNSCRELMRQLKTKTANDFLNARIRCRHLTVGVVREIPWAS
ncbi:MAG: SAM-dependent DNA methyltransferase [Verrucomicrobia bacterium]|nr:SAM-dependent DNA methyltransferase [Verrucomicrobiota bacterium]